MPPTHPTQADVAAAYRTLIAHETEPKEQDFYRTRLQRLELRTEPESDDFVTQLAVKQIEGEAAWWRSIDFDRNASRTFESMTGDSQQAVRTGVERVLAYLQSTSRLVPAGGMALTAEQVEDVEALVATANPYSAPAARLRALFPATEPAKELLTREQAIAKWKALGVHASDCALHNEPASPAGPCNCHMSKADETWQTLATVPATVSKVVDTKGREFWRGEHGWKPYYFEDGTDHNTFAPFKPAPAEPAEEETKAEESAGTVCDETQKAYDEAVSLSYWLAKQLGEHVDDAYDRGETLTDTVQRLIEHIRPNRGKTKTTSSPVVPAPTETEAEVSARCREHDLYGRQCMDYAGHAHPHRLVLPTGDTHHWDTPSPTETGPWETLQDVPEGVTRVLDSECELWVQEGGQWFSTCQLHNPAEFAPFVAAEEG